MADTALRATASDRSRVEWIALADRLLGAAAAFGSRGRGRVLLPGAPGGYGRDIDGLEGFARTFLLAGFRIAGDHGRDLDGLIDFYRTGVATGVDPAAPDRWVRLTEHPQAKVEAASIALALDMTRPWIWDALDDVTRRRVVEYLQPAVGDRTYPRTNWLWFRVIVQTFLRSVGGPWSPDDVAEDLAMHESFRRSDGWLSDGDERSFDHYVGWALHLLPVLWSRMRGAADLGSPRAGVAELDRFLQDALHLIGGDGSPLLQGRSLIYRFAAAGPFWAGVLADVPSISPGRLRHAADRVVGHFERAGALGTDDLLTLGWHRPWRPLAQRYSGPGSPYWAVKGLLGVALPAEHPVWSAPSEPLPIENGDTVRAVVAPGWLLSGTREDGVVRVVNHGTDHARPEQPVGDSPLYARIGYSTATAPLLDQEAWTDPLDQSVAVLDEAGRATHRAGLRCERAEVVDLDGTAVGVAAATWLAHWIEPDREQLHHGSGLAGTSTAAARLRVDSVVRGPWELRVIRVESITTALDLASLRLRVGGWAVTGPDGGVERRAAGRTVRRGLLASSLDVLDGLEPELSVRERPDAGPLGSPSAVPVVELPLRIDAPITVVVGLGAAPDGRVGPMLTIRADGSVAFRWPDGLISRVDHLFGRSPWAPDENRATSASPVPPSGMQRSTNR